MSALVGRVSVKQDRSGLKPTPLQRRTSWSDFLLHLLLCLHHQHLPLQLKRMMINNNSNRNLPLPPPPTTTTTLSLFSMSISAASVDPPSPNDLPSTPRPGASLMRTWTSWSPSCCSDSSRLHSNDTTTQHLGINSCLC